MHIMNISIHPGKKRPAAKTSAAKTSAARKRTKGHLAKAEKARNDRRNAHAASSSSFQAASKVPGSMKWK